MRRISPAIGLLVLVALVHSSRAQVLGSNVIVNGGAETGDLTGWIDGGIEVVDAVDFQAGFGDFTFTGGTGVATCQTLTQEVSLADIADLIDNTCISGLFEIQLQSRLSDIATCTIEYLDATGQTLATWTVSDPGGSTFDWDYYFDQRIVPTGARAFRVTLCSTRSGGGSSDSYFDEVSLILTSAGGDFNHDTVFDFFDVLAFLQSFANQEPVADYTDDGLFDFFDVQSFLQAFALGCP